MSGSPAAVAAPIIVSALFAREDQAFFDAQRTAHFPPERNVLAAHLTMFHHLPPSIEHELGRRLAEETRGVPAPAARLAGLIPLGRGVAYRIEAPGLAAIRARLAEAFAGLLTPQDQAGWRAHVTIQNKVDPASAKTLFKALEADFRPRPLRLAALASWWYRGGPWEQIARHSFR